ncbi:unnamed protein product [Adineta steineri]|uniref:Uncharacterized protein n=1 Tax=Adineta steineri TaxID=433720 RepID=A0A815KPX3_9BILA|nr:unnamed protein product [Adineta steineri]CAF1399287.1 unnamed protein product [Adineta steineri]CAF3791003.1 unnamed protein product [Adineta steineri]CAF4074684.1 unnamed protein product [Adineta steineri]
MEAFSRIRNTWNRTSRVTKVCVIGGAAAATAPFLIIPALSVVGFTSAGVAGGSIAAAFQTATTASGSFFALCQSAGAVGAVATSTSLGVGAAAGVAAGGIAAAVIRETVDVGVQTDDDENFPDNVEVLADVH